MGEPDITIRCHYAKVVRYKNGTIAFMVDMPDGSVQSMMMTRGDFLDLNRAISMMAATLETDGQHA